MSDPYISLVPLVPNLALPRLSTARTRTLIPPGYGIQEHCLPFTAASGLGVLIPSPIRFGLCLPEEAPQGCRMFRSPLNTDTASEPRVFYVFDNTECRFSRNAYQFEGIPVDGSPPILEPGISFFDRSDQQHLFKLHLPYVWRTQEAMEILFLPLLNRSGLDVLCGLVETDWYPSPVNLIIAKPIGAAHFQIGDPIAHALLIPRNLRQVSIEVLKPHSRISRETRKRLHDWDKKHAQDRAAYKMLAREQDRLAETPPKEME